MAGWSICLGQFVVVVVSWAFSFGSLGSRSLKAVPSMTSSAVFGFSKIVKWLPSTKWIFTGDSKYCKFKKFLRNRNILKNFRLKFIADVLSTIRSRPEWVSKSRWAGSALWVFSGPLLAGALVAPGLLPFDIQRPSVTFGSVCCAEYLEGLTRSPYPNGRSSPVVWIGLPLAVSKTKELI